MSTAIRIDGAKKSFRDALGRRSREAVRDVSIAVDAGAVHGLLGPNGAGKTTTVKMLLGLVRADAGVFEVFGEDPRRAANRVDLGFLPEQPYYPMFGAAQRVLARYARLSGVDGSIDGAVEDALQAVGLGPHASLALSKYSRGMLQRFGIAQALIGDPRVVILDEPASGLDPVGQRDVRNLVLELKSRGVTVLLSSHQLSEVETVCDQVTIVNGGVVAASGSITELLSVEGQTSVRVSGFDALPESVGRLATDTVTSGAHWLLSVPDEALRTVVDAVDDGGGSVISVMPKRDSLEDYFDRMLRGSGEAAGGDADA